jgi:predicted phosphohydrolase
MKKPASVTGIKLVGLHRQSFENAIGNNWHNIVHPDDVQVIMDILF